jgi:beta-phosphoglucomutase-like phosphatase (HAD superfamily)
MRPIELVIFDNDGVVVDSGLLANRVLSELLTEHGHPTSIDECIRDYVGVIFRGWMSSSNSSKSPDKGWLTMKQQRE